MDFGGAASIGGSSEALLLAAAGRDSMRGLRAQLSVVASTGRDWIIDPMAAV